MPDLNSSMIQTVRERIIYTTKKYGTNDEGGYKIGFPVLAECLDNDEVLLSDDELKKIKVTEGNFYSFFKGDETISFQMFSDEGTHYLLLKPKYPLTSEEVQEKAKKVIDDVLSRQGHLPIKTLYDELSRRIVFFEYYLRTNNISAKEYIQKLVPEKGDSALKDEATKAIEEKAKKPAEKPGTIWIHRLINRKGSKELLPSNDELKPIVAEAICRTIMGKGELWNGYHRMPIDKLCTELVRDSEEFNYFRAREKGSNSEIIARHFKKLLLFDSVEKELWVRLASEEAEKKETGEKEDPAETIDQKVREDILEIVEQQGVVFQNYRQIVLGTLVNELAAGSASFLLARSRYKGPTRNYLLQKFGQMLVIEYIDGKDWVRIPLTAFEKKEQDKPAAEPQPLRDQKPVDMAKKTRATDLLIRELTNLNNDELVQLQMVLRLAYETDEPASTEALKKKTNPLAERNVSSGLAEIAGRVGLNAKAVLAKNDVLQQITAYMSVEEIAGIIKEEIALRKGPVVVPTSSRKDDSKHLPELGSNFPYVQEIMTDTDYEGLDEWLPF